MISPTLEKTLNLRSKSALRLLAQWRHPSDCAAPAKPASRPPYASTPSRAAKGSHRQGPHRRADADRHRRRRRRRRRRGNRGRDRGPDGHRPGSGQRPDTRHRGNHRRSCRRARAGRDRHQPARHRHHPRRRVPRPRRHPHHLPKRRRTRRPRRNRTDLPRLRPPTRSPGSAAPQPPGPRPGDQHVQLHRPDPLPTIPRPLRREPKERPATKPPPPCPDNASTSSGPTSSTRPLPAQTTKISTGGAAPTRVETPLAEDRQNRCKSCSGPASVVR